MNQEYSIRNNGDVRTFILFVSYSMTRPLWYHVMLAAGLEPYEMQSRLLGCPERKGCSAPVIATLNGFTVKCFDTKFDKIGTFVKIYVTK